MKLLLFTLISLSTFAYSGDCFIENIGQVKNQLGESNSDVLYIFNSSELTVTLRSQGFSYEVKKITNSTSDLKDLLEDYKFNTLIERIDFEFPNKPSQIVAESKFKSYINVYSNIGSFENISQFRKVLYKGVADGVDIEFIIENGQFKYNIIVKPEANLSQFFIKINSDKTPFLNQNNLILKTINGEIKENIPVSYLEDSKREIEVIYKLEGQKLFFDPTENYGNEALIIDPIPDLIWNSYFGGSQYDVVNDIDVSTVDEIYQTGITMSLNNISTSGAFQENYQGDLDAFISKFDIDGNLIWSTYYAGDQSERVYNISLDSIGNCYIGGSTFSTTGIATQGVHQQYIDGADDMFMLKLFPNGQRDWCTYHGGNGHDFITDMTVFNDTIFLTGHTTSTNNIASSGAHLENNTTSEAGHLSLFSTSGNFLWGTFFGNDNNNSVEGIAVNHNSIYITGRTNSLTGIATPGTHQESLTGFVDGFIAKFDKTGLQIWGTYFGGDYTDKSNSITLDENDYLYICGDASSENQIATPGAHQEYRLSSEQGFVSKFSSEGQQIWGSYTGGSSSDYLHTIKYKNGFIYLGGQTLSADEITTANAYQLTKSNGFDLFIQKFDTTGALNWGTYFGDVANENLSNIVLTKNQQIIISGNSDASSMNFTTINAHQESFGGGSSDGFLTYLCQPVKPQIYYDEGQLISSTADEYAWYFENNPLNEYSQSIQPNEDGNYYVVTSNNGLCEDTSEIFSFSTVKIHDKNLQFVKLYPNPTSDKITIESKDLIQVNLMGINNKVISSKSGSGKIILDLQNLAKGMYLIKITGKKIYMTKKIIKS